MVATGDNIENGHHLSVCKYVEKVPPDLLCFWHCMTASEFPLLWSTVPRQDSGYPKEGGYLKVEVPLAKQLRTEFRDSMEKRYGECDSRVQEIDNGTYMAEDII